MDKTQAATALTSLANLPDYGVFIGISLLFLVAGAAIFSAITPYNELKLIRDGNAAAGVAYGGNIVALALVINSISTSTHDYALLALWSGVGLVVQLITFFALCLVFPKLFTKIEQDGCMAHGATVAAASIGVALLNAGALSA